MSESEELDAEIEGYYASLSEDNDGMDSLWLFTLRLGLQQFQFQQGGADWNLLSPPPPSLSPILILVLFSQRQFIEGIALSGLKG